MWGNTVLVSILMLAALLVQTAVLPALGVTAVAPELLMAVLIVCAMLWQPLPTAVIGVVFGLIMDILFGRGIGMYSLPYLLVSWIAPAARRQFDARFVPVVVVYAAVCYLLRDAVMLGLLYLVRVENPVSGATVLRSLLSAALTGGAALVLYYPLYKWFHRHDERNFRFRY